jgi:hypothetical protein
MNQELRVRNQEITPSKDEDGLPIYDCLDSCFLIADSYK